MPAPPHVSYATAPATRPSARVQFVAQLRVLFQQLTPTERLALLADYCTYCGAYDPRQACQCVTVKVSPLAQSLVDCLPWSRTLTR